MFTLSRLNVYDGGDTVAVACIGRRCVEVRCENTMKYRCLTTKVNVEVPDVTSKGSVWFSWASTGLSGPTWAIRKNTHGPEMGTE